LCWDFIKCLSAAGLLNEVRPNIPIYLIDPFDVDTSYIRDVRIIKANAGDGLTRLVNELLENNKK